MWYKVGYSTLNLHIYFRSQRNAKAVKPVAQQNDEDNPVITIKTPPKDITSAKNTKRMRFSELSPVVSQSNTKPARSVIQPALRKTVRLKSNEKTVSLKTPIVSKKPRKIAEAPKEESPREEESSASEAANESDGDLFHEEEIFSFATQDIADYDDVLGLVKNFVDIFMVNFFFVSNLSTVARLSSSLFWICYNQLVML